MVLTHAINPHLKRYATGWYGINPHLKRYATGWYGEQWDFEKKIKRQYIISITLI
jgi:hypothetical protein